MLISVLLHELAHLVAMYLLGCRPTEIKLIPSQVVIVRDVSLKCRNEILISFSGPLLNLILFFIFYFFLPEFAVINLLFGVFNLLPLKGVDGGEIVEVLISAFFGEKTAVIILKILNISVCTLGSIYLLKQILSSNINISFIIMLFYFLLSVIVKL